MSTRLGISITKDNGFDEKSVSSGLNSGEVTGSNSNETSGAIAYASAYESAQGSSGVFPLASKYNGKPNYKSLSSYSESISFSPERSSSLAGTTTLGKPNYNTSVITMDWLSITFRVSLPSKDEEFTNDSWLDSSGRLGIKLEDRRIQHYRYYGKCFLDGVQFGEITFCPYENSVLQKDFAKLKLDNELFYTGDWLQYVNEFKALTGAIFNNVSRLDIAIDYSWEYGRQILDFVKTVKMGESKYRKLGVKNLEYQSREGVNDGFTVGRRSGNKCAVFYNKSLEIRERSNKDYITAYHSANGLDTSQDVCRFEIRLDGEAVKSVAGFSLEKLTDTDYLVSLVKTHINNWFEFVPSIAVNVSRAKRFDVLRLEAISFAVSYLERVKRKVRSNARAIKISVKCLIEQIYLGGNKGQYSECVKSLLATSNLKEWLDRRFEDIIKCLDKKFRFIADPAIDAQRLADLLEVQYNPVLKRAVA